MRRSDQAHPGGCGLRRAMQGRVEVRGIRKKQVFVAVRRAVHEIARIRQSVWPGHRGLARVSADLDGWRKRLAGRQRIVVPPLSTEKSGSIACVRLPPRVSADERYRLRRGPAVEGKGES